MVETKINGWKSREAARAQMPPMDQLFFGFDCFLQEVCGILNFYEEEIAPTPKSFFNRISSPPKKKLEGRRTTKRQVRDSWHGRPHIGANGVS